MNCKWCALDNGNYDMSLICCKVRYLLQEPRKEVRRAWLDRWAKKYGSEDVEAVKAELLKRWKEK